MLQLLLTSKWDLPMENMFPKQIANNYYIMRHGESKANEQGLIISNPKVGINGYGLTKTGKEQARKAAITSQLDSSTFIYSSNFARAKETAAIVSEVLNTAFPKTETDLRERWFGEFDFSSCDNYDKVWEYDVQFENHTAFGVESPAKVLMRMSSVIKRIEEKFCGISVLLISHGDPSQILLTAAAGYSTTMHRRLPHLQTAEIRPCFNSVIKENK